jgi:glycosyltransferase 2 family protein
MPPKKIFLFFLKGTIAVLALAYLFRYGRLSASTFSNFFSWENVPLILVSCAFLIGAQLLSVFRLILLLRTIHFPLRYPEGLKLNMIGFFFNTVLPGALGGDLVKGYYLYTIEQVMKGRSLGILLMDRICGFLAILLIGAFSILYLVQQQSSHLTSHANETEIVLASIVGSLALFGLIFILGRNASVRSKLEQIDILRSKPLQNLIVGFGALLQSERTFFNCILISIAMQVLSLSGLLALSRFGGAATPDLVALIAVSTIVIVISVIPITPGNIGWTELMAAYGWSAVGSGAGAEVFLYWRIVTVLCALPGGICYLIYGTGEKLNRNSISA